MELQLHPQPVELGPAKESFTLRFELIGKLAHKINRTDFGDRELDMLAFRREYINGIELAEASRVQVSAQGFPVGKHKNDFLVRRGWGSGFQNRQIPVWKIANLPIGRMYVMLSTLFLSSCCFYWG